MKVSPKYLILLTIAALIAVMWSVVPYCLDTLNGAGSTVTPIDDGTAKRQVVSSDESNSTYPRDFVYPVDNIRDPFIQMSAAVDIPTQTASPGRKTGMTLTGIIWDDDDPIAIAVDSRKESHIVRTGDELDEARIIAIRTRSIIIETDGKQEELILWPEKL